MKRNGKAGSVPGADRQQAKLALRWLPRSIYGWLVLITIALIFSPTLVGAVLSTKDAFAPDAITRALAMPGIWQSAALSLWTGLAATLFSVVLTLVFFAGWAGTRPMRWLSGLVRPLLSIPHAAAAFALLFLVAPSGWFMRLVAPLIGIARPPDLLLVNDPWGLSLAAGMALKETPFLIFVALAALNQLDARQNQVARSLGHGQMWGWLSTLGPGIYQQIRLPIIAALAFATSAIDMALILGPGTPPTLAVQILRWVNDPDLSLRQAASAAALLQFGVTTLAILIWLALEHLVRQVMQRIWQSGWRGQLLDRFRGVVLAITIWTLGIVFIGAFVLALWAYAAQWRFPDLFPTAFTMRTWVNNAPQIVELAVRTLQIGIMSTVVSLILAIACLENEYRLRRPLGALGWFALYLPLILPQIVFVTGLSSLFLRLGFDANDFAVALVHIIFVFPYIYLTLAASWNRFDQRFLLVANAMGKTPDQALLRVRLPMLLTPILVAAALGFSVSVAQYLPTLLIGAGRTPTLTTEAIALAAGGNRRLIGLYALLQALLPFIAFVLAVRLPHLIFANRQGMRGQTESAQPA